MSNILFRTLIGVQSRLLYVMNTSAVRPDCDQAHSLHISPASLFEDALKSSSVNLHLMGNLLHRGTAVHPDGSQGSHTRTQFQDFD